MTLRDQLAAARVLPVVTAEDVDATVRLAAVLAQSGMTAIEITLRTDAALEAIAAVRSAMPDLLLAAGTVLTPEDVARAGEAGAGLCISPGISAELLAATAAAGLPYLPGVATASEVMLGLSAGVDTFKLFPAVPVGGVALLRALHGPFPSVRFCPTGGLGAGNFRDFLALPNVICCGGSWMAGQDLIHSERWEDIAALAREAMRNDS
ncbi:MAG: bifunctional 4-hydroxy-2-oxoglutarate aldolase/2-dehydro-3-deoxy-phosphogluconate aldolase [Halioglobus sp.]|nr:bifunctional 4-hydroxy-2-oxoglutarate aldolase/2-dehydro-3-deoxy-phosphogluconate aldolase [Halioglobus sp.]